MAEALRVGLVGAGPWGRDVHAPGLVAHPGTELTAVWTRRPEAAQELARRHGATAAATFEELLSEVDAVAFAVPPAVQEDLAVRAARAGRHLIVEKPIASTVDGALRLADAVREADVVALVMLTLRYAPETVAWLERVRATGGWSGAGARWLSGAFLGERYGGSPWRQAAGALLDVGPHVIDLLDAALGPVSDVVAARGAETGLWQLMLAHEGGAISTATVSASLPVDPTVVELHVYGEHGVLPLAARQTPRTECYRAMLDDVVELVRTGRREHPCDLRRGLHLQRVISAALSAAGTDPDWSAAGSR